MKEIKFKPLSNYILIEFIVKKGRKKGNLHIPETAERKVLDSTVVAISEEKLPDGTPMVKNVKVGDKVIFNIHTGEVIDVYDAQYLCLRETELFGILEPDPDYVVEEPSNIIQLSTKVN